MMSSGKTFEVTDVGIYTPALQPVESLAAGEVGFMLPVLKM